MVRCSISGASVLPLRKSKLNVENDIITSGGIQPAIKAIKKSIKLTNTAETLALVTTPRKSPIPKNKRQIKRYQYIEVNIVLVRS